MDSKPHVHDDMLKVVERCPKIRWNFEDMDRIAWQVLIACTEEETTHFACTYAKIRTPGVETNGQSL